MIHADSNIRVAPVRTTGPPPTALLPVVTLVLWLGCLAVGIGGLVLRYPRALPPDHEPPPAIAGVLNVDVTEHLAQPEARSPAPPPAALPPEALPPLQPPSPPQEVAAPAAPPLTAVAAPSPAIAFAVPVEGPTRVVDARQAGPPPPRAAPPAAATAPSPQSAVPPVAARASPGAATDAPPQLLAEDGEGRQPAPEYPREAKLARQQGTVVLRVTLGRGGRVVNVDLGTPSSSALLNQAAARTVREKWGPFPKHSPGIYEVIVEFKLNER
jgi:protein TonB